MNKEMSMKQLPWRRLFAAALAVFAPLAVLKYRKA